MRKRKSVWLVWEIQIVDIGKDKVQFQNLRVIAGSSERSECYKKAFENENHLKKETWFKIEEREINHAFGYSDMNRFVSKNRN